MRFLVGLLGFCILAAHAALAEVKAVKAALLTVETDQPLPISRLDLPPDNLGIAGAMLATDDNQTTGSFLGQEFTLEHVTAAPEDALAALDKLLADEIAFIGVLGDPDTLLAVADAAGDRALIFNVDAADNELRNDSCRANMLHMVPSYGMRADALAQYLVWKKWDSLSIISGSHDKDKKWADALRNSANKFGLRVRDELEFEDTGGARRTDTGHVLVQKQMPVFTQPIDKADVILVADESEVFGAYLPYHSWTPTLIAGSAGLRPLSWHPALEAWGATQFQRRFERDHGRYMRDEDYQAWLAFRVLGEAATRTNSTDPSVLKDYILSEEFEMAGFKGEKLTFRPWNGQLRQPILLANDKLIVSVSPQEGFLHQTSLLDTMGSDEPETSCTAFK